MKFINLTESICPICHNIIPAKVISDGKRVYHHKFCPEHGHKRVLVWNDLQHYFETLRYVKPAVTPLGFTGDKHAKCPEGCGFCDRHEQHLCMPIIEITSRCNLACPICLVNAGKSWDMSLSDFRRILDNLIRVEKQIDIINISGGEPLLHPELFSILEEAASRPEVVRVSISTNGLCLLERPDLLKKLKELNIVISLQLDGFDDKTYKFLRGRPLIAEKQRILDLLAKEEMTASLIMTLAGGVNETQLRPILDYFFSQKHLASLMIQPLAFSGQASKFAESIPKISIYDTINLLNEAGHPAVNKTDFVPLPCSHPLCFSLAFYLVMENKQTVSVNTLVNDDMLLDSMANHSVYGLKEDEYENLKEMIYELWSGPVASCPDNAEVLKTLRKIIKEMSCSCFNPRAAFSTLEQNVKSIFIHGFQDVTSFDLARLRRCCSAYPQTDGRLLPACARNLLNRD